MPPWEAGTEPSTGKASDQVPEQETLQGDGCGRSARADYCTLMCRRLDEELDRLHELYQTAGDPTLIRDAWLALVDCADAWTEYAKARAKLHYGICEAGLPLPT